MPSNYAGFPNKARRVVFLANLLTAMMVFFGSAPSSLAQQNPSLENGTKPFGSYEGSDIDSLSLTNGNVNVRIPLFAFPQRGSLGPLQYLVEGGAKNWMAVFNKSLNAYQWQLQSVPGAYLAATSSIAISLKEALLHQVINGQDYYSVDYFVVDPDGVTHEMGYIAPNVWESVDATGFRLDGPSAAVNQTTKPGGNLPYVVTDRHGTHFIFTSAPLVLSLNTGLLTGYAHPTSVKDRNGNEISIPNSGPTTDSMGRATTFASGGLSNCPSGTSTANISTFPTVGGGTSSVTYCYSNISLQTAFNEPLNDGTGRKVLEYSGTTSGITAVVLPNHTMWKFTYDSYGAVTSITFPNSGKISYTWTTASACVSSGGMTRVSRAVATKTVSSGSVSGTWNFTWGTWGAGGNWTTINNVVADPQGNETVHTITDLSSGYCSLYETETLAYAGLHTSGSLLRTINKTYSFSGNWADVTDSFLGAINVVQTDEVTTLDDGQVVAAHMTYDSNNSLTYGNLLRKDEYDYGQGAKGPLLRSTVNTYQAFTSANYLANNLLNLPSSVQVLDGGGTQQAYTTYGYDESGLQTSGITEQKVAGESFPGNQTSVHHWLNSGTFNCPGGASGGSGGFIVSNTSYYDTGEVYSTNDPCGHSTSYQYSSTYFGAFPTTVTNALGQAITNAYDCDIGKVTSSTDPNQLITNYSYDSMWRISQTNRPDGGQDTVTRQEASFPFTATLTSTINTSQSTIPLSVFDGLGRVSQTQVTSDPQGTVVTDTTYDAFGRVSTVSNPYRSGTDATSSPGSTTYGYDALSRKTTENYPDGSVLTTAYCGPNTLVTDPTGKWRRSRINGLGQLVEVDEPNAIGASVASTGCPGVSDPVLVTSYTYDVLGNLKQVVQNGSHTRTFTYDALSRLLTSANPETGMIAYTYNPDGTVLTKTDARSIITSYTYDALHRNTGVSYSNGDPSLTFSYDEANCLGLAACQNLGHRTSMTDGVGSEKWAYQADKPNNRSIHREQRTTNGITKTTTYYLDLQGNVTQIVYPTGRTVNYTYDSANRPSSAVDGSNGITYVADSKTPPSNTNCTPGAVCYTPQGSVYSMSIGQTSTFTGFNISETFNARLQPNEIKASSSAGTAFDITYNFVDPATSKNAGHVYGITNNLVAGRSQAFTYDQLNRIMSAGTTATTGSTCWGYQYSYDAWGNLLSQAGWTPIYNSCTEGTMSVVADGNNHLSGSGFSYDTAGNTLNDGNYAYTYDGESQLKTAGGVTYSYDGDGRRVAKVGNKLYWYGSGGEILSETDAAGNTLNEYVYFGGKRVALVPTGGSALYYAQDTLGSSRVIVQTNGTLCYDADFTPFGGERAYTNTCPQNYKFEGKERDAETQNDDFGAREYSSRFGRWLTSDWSSVPVAVPYANLTNPQTLNLYSMVSDDPESFADLDGHASVGVNAEGMWVQPRLSLGSAYGSPTDVMIGGFSDADINAMLAADAVQQKPNIAWSSLDAAQQALVPGGQKAWDALPGRQGMGEAQSNYAAITHALEQMKLSDGTTGLAQIKSVEKDGIGPTGIAVTWKAGAAKAFESSGFASRPGKGHPGESGMIGMPTAKGIKGHFWQAQGVHVLFKDADKGATGHVHIDYRGLSSGHFGGANDDVRQNYQTYQKWFGTIPGYSP